MNRIAALAAGERDRAGSVPAVRRAGRGAIATPELEPGPVIALEDEIARPESTELVRAGATYYSDEYAVFDSRGRVHPFAQQLAQRLGDGADEGEVGFDLWVGGGLGARPRLAERLGAFIWYDEVPEVVLLCPTCAELEFGSD